MQYRGSTKHKQRPGRGRKGTLCPEWTHRSDSDGKLGAGIDKHRWSDTPAQRMLDGSIVDPTDASVRYATAGGIAFAARPTNDGSWHGYPVPWTDVPEAIKDRWVDENLVGPRALRQYARAAEADIQWALASDDD